MILAIVTFRTFLDLRAGIVTFRRITGRGRGTVGAVVWMRRYRFGEHVTKKLEERRVPSGWYVELRECSWAGAVSQDSRFGTQWGSWEEGGERSFK